jgi:hypothetical protein
MAVFQLVQKIMLLIQQPKLHFSGFEISEKGGFSASLLYFIILGEEVSDTA